MFNKVYAKMLYFKISERNRVSKECKKKNIFSHLKTCQIMEVN